MTYPRAMAITNLSAAQLRRAAGLRDKIEQLEKQLAVVLGDTGLSAPATRSPGRGKVAAGRAAAPGKSKRNISKAARAKMSAAAKARWAKVKAAGKNRL